MKVVLSAPVNARAVFRARGRRVIRDIPYGAVLQALREITRQWLAESDDRLAAWRARILSALGATAACSPR